MGCEKRHQFDQRDLFKNKRSGQSKLTKEYMKTSKQARRPEKPAKNPTEKKGQEIWDGTSTTYVPRQDLKLNRLQISKSYQK